MSVGFATNKNDVDSKSGSICRMIAQWSDETVKFQEGFLAGATEEQLVALGYTTEDVALLKSAIGDMYKLTQIYRGMVDQTPAYDFRTFAKRLTGVSL